MIKVFFVAAMILGVSSIYAQEPESDSGSGCGSDGCGCHNGQIRYYPTGYEIDGRRYFYNNYCFPGWDVHHGVAPDWPSRNPPYYYGWWYWNY